MPQNIYFGSVEIVNTRTKQAQIIPDQVFKELDELNDEGLRIKILRQFKPVERVNLKITKLCFDTAKQLGQTVY